MCGRYATTRTAADLSALFEALDVTGTGVVADYNVAPTDPVPVVRMSRSHSAEPERPVRVLEVARWGLLPPWATDRRAGARMINARAETVATARAYARPFAARRCLVPAAGWYEFAPRADGRGKQAYFMTPRDGSPIVFGGLWSVWGEGEDRLLTCSIVTREAIGALRDVHDRMPLILPPDRWAGWLTAEPDPETLLAAPSDAFVDAVEIRPVGPAVGDVRNDGPGLIEARPTTAPADLTLF